MVATSILGVDAPVVDVYLGRARNHQLQFARIKHRDQPRVDHLVEAAHQRLRLLLHTAFQPPPHHSLQILLLVLLSHRNRLAARLQLALHDAAQQLLGHAEHQVQRAAGANVVVAHPLQRLVELVVQRLEIAERHGQPEQRLVERSRKEGVQQVLVDERQSEHATAEAEPIDGRHKVVLNTLNHQVISQRFLYSPVVTIVDERRQRRQLYGVRVVCRVLKQSVVRIEQFARQQKEELARRPTVIEALLGVPQHGEAAALKVLLVCRHDAPEGVLEQVRSADVQPIYRRLLFESATLFKYQLLTLACAVPGRSPSTPASGRTNAASPQSHGGTAAAVAGAGQRCGRRTDWASPTGDCASAPARSS